MEVLGERIARFLVERRRLTPAQLVEARRTQEFFGGQLESHLLKLGFVDEVSLGEALTDATGAPYASGERLRAIPIEALESLPFSVIERHRVVPFAIADGRLRLAMLNPRDARVLNEIQAATRLVLEPWITSEYRMYQALEKHFRIRPAGVKAIALAPPVVHREEEREAGPAVGEESPAEPEIGLDGKPIDADWDFGEVYRSDGEGSEEAEAKSPPDTEPAPDPGPPPRTIEPDGLAEESVAPTTAAGALALLDASLGAVADRAALAEALLGFCATLSSRAALFAVSKEDVRGVSGRGRGFEPTHVRKLRSPLGASTVFDAALGSRDFYFGVVPPLPPNRDLYTFLGGRIPANVLIVPIRVRGRTVALLYLDDDDRPMTHPDIPLMLRVAAKAGLASEILLLRRKLTEI